MAKTPMVPKEQARKEFAARLQKILFEMHISQSELARRVEATLPEGQTFGRYLISSWVRGKVLPQGENFEALRKALNIPAEKLMPFEQASQAELAAPALSMRDSGNGKCWLQVNQETSWPQASAISQILNPS